MTHDIKDWLAYEETYYKKFVDEDGNIVVDMDMDYGMEGSYGGESEEKKYDYMQGRTADEAFDEIYMKEEEKYGPGQGNAAFDMIQKLNQEFNENIEKGNKGKY